MMDMWLFSESKLRTKFDTIIQKVAVAILYNYLQNTKQRIREIVMTEKIFMDLLEY